MLRTVSIASLVLMGACDLEGLFGSGNQGTFEPLPQFGFEYLKSSHARAAAKEQVTLEWAYATDDEVVFQRICFLYLYFDGIGEECFEGDDITPLRDSSFRHPGAFTVVVHAEAADGRTAQAALQVKDLQDAYLSATFHNDLTFYPYLGGATDPDTLVNGQPATVPTSHVEFEQFVALADDDGDGLIDGLTGLFEPTNGSAFRAKTVDLVEQPDATFRAAQGPAYPLEFPENPALGGISNLVVYGGAIAVLGEEHTFKTWDGSGEDGTFRTGPELFFDPIFINLVYTWRPNTGIIDPVDIQVGNLTTNLVVGVTGTQYPGAFFGEPHLRDIHEVGNEPWMSGSIKGAQAGLQITRQSDDTPTWAGVQLADVDWNMPIHNDEDLGNNPFLELL